MKVWAFRLEDSPSGHSLQVLARITALRAFRFSRSAAKSKDFTVAQLGVLTCQRDYG